MTNEYKLEIDVDYILSPRLLKEHIQREHNGIKEIEMEESVIKITSYKPISQESIVTLVKRLNSKYKILEKFNNRNVDIEPDYLLNREEKKAYKESIQKTLEFVGSENLKLDTTDIIKSNKGANIYSEKAAKVIEAISLLIRTYFNNIYNNKNLKGTSLIPSNILRKSGYFDKSFDHVCFTSLGETPSKEAGISDVALNPAVCLHTYPLYENSIIEEIVCIGIEGDVFRNEGKSVNNEERLNEFLVQEVVFLGKSQELKKIHKTLISYMMNFFDLLNLNVNLEVAHDIFFGGNEEKYIFSQLISGDKIETIYNSEDAEFSVGSLNKHKTYFSEKFNIRGSDGNYVESMCLAFGVSRILYAIYKEKINISELLKKKIVILEMKNE